MGRDQRRALAAFFRMVALGADVGKEIAMRGTLEQGIRQLRDLETAIRETREILERAVGAAAVLAKAGRS